MLSEQEILKNKLSIYTIAIFFGLNVQPIHWTCLHRNIELKNYLLVRTLKRFEACVDGLKKMNFLNHYSMQILLRKLLKICVFSDAFFLSIFMGQGSVCATAKHNFLIVS